MLNYLKTLGLKTPEYGTVKEIYLHFMKLFNEDLVMVNYLIEVVVHLDITSHRGEGKIKLPIKEALERYADNFAVQFIPATMNGLGLGVSWRYLQIGDRKFWLEYSSTTDWRSNCGEEVEIKILSQEKSGFHPKINLPLFSVDFVNTEGKLYALDFNVAPQIRGTGIERLISDKEVAGIIKKYVGG